ncbi:MAG: hypothetical protein AAFN77_21040 [Planctomycetota bacterium]
MAGEEIGTMEHELYDVSHSSEFTGIIGKPIADIVKIQARPNDGQALPPFGVRLNFANDYIQVFPNTDGTAIETKTLQWIGNLSDFRHFGELEFESLD